jgi:hypothetical protein
MKDSCRKIAGKHHSKNELSECAECGMSSKQIADENYEHMKKCVRIAFHYDDPDFMGHGPREKEVRNTPVTYAHFLKMFQGPID